MKKKSIDKVKEKAVRGSSTVAGGVIGATLVGSAPAEASVETADIADAEDTTADSADAPATSTGISGHTHTPHEPHVSIVYNPNTDTHVAPESNHADTDIAQPATEAIETEASEPVVTVVEPTETVQPEIEATPVEDTPVTEPPADTVNVTVDEPIFAQTPNYDENVLDDYVNNADVNNFIG